MGWEEDKGEGDDRVHCKTCGDLIMPNAPVYCDKEGNRYHDAPGKRCRPKSVDSIKDFVEDTDTADNTRKSEEMVADTEERTEKIDAVDEDADGGDEDGSDFREEDIRLTYRFLGHAKETEIRLIHPSGKKAIKSLFVHSEKEFVEVCKKHNGQYNIYAGVNERKPGGTRAEDVLCVNIIPFDIDPVRPKDEASTDEELQRASLVAHKTMDYFRSEGKNPYLAMSGNGSQIWIRISLPLDDGIRLKVQGVIQDLQKHVMKEFSNNKVKIDNVGDLPRIIKVIGTLSIKGSNTVERPWRVSRWVEPPTKMNPDRTWSMKLRKLALAYEDTEAKLEAPASQAELCEEELKGYIERLDEKGRDLLEGSWEKYGFQSRSEAEQSLAVKLALLGMTQTEAWAAMEQSLIGKWKKKDDNYKRLTLVKAFAFATTKGTDTKAKVENGGGGTAFPSYVVLTVKNPAIVVSISPRKGGGHTLRLPEELGSQILDFYPQDPKEKILEWMEGALKKAGVEDVEAAKAILGERLFSSVNWWPEDFLRHIQYSRLGVGQIYTIPVRIEGEVIVLNIDAEKMDSPTVLKKKLLAHNVNLLVPSGKWSGVLGALMEAGSKRPFDPTLERGFSLVEDVKNWVVSRQDVIAESGKDLEGTNYEFPVWIGERLGVHNKKVETMAKVYKVDSPRKLSAILSSIVLPHMDQRGVKHNTMTLRIGKETPRFWLFHPDKLGVSRQKKLEEAEDDD